MADIAATPGLVVGVEVLNAGIAPLPAATIGLTSGVVVMGGIAPITNIIISTVPLLSGVTTSITAPTPPPIPPLPPPPPAFELAVAPCLTVADACESDQADPAKSLLCGHTPEEFAEVALVLEPRGALWSKLFTTIRAAVYRAFGKLLSDVEQRLCDLFKESLACQSVELLGEWENEYGLPGDCVPPGSYPTTIAGRQAMVCAARKRRGGISLLDLQAILRGALDCPYLLIEKVFDAGVYTGLCIRNIGYAPPLPGVHNVVGGRGLISAPYGSAVGQPLTVDDPTAVAQSVCPIVYHSTTSAWTGGIGQPLRAGNEQKFNLLVCLINKYLPAHIQWQACP
jgi:hypothetical protein